MFEPNDPRNSLYLEQLPFKAFVSSKMSGEPLAAERKVAIEAVEEYPQIRAWAWEKDAPAGSYYSEEECERQAGTSQILILILDREITRVTRAEYAAAYSAGATIIALLKRDADRDESLTRFVDRLRKEAITKEFDDLDELRSEIANALWAWTMRAGQTVTLAARRLREVDGDSGLLEAVELHEEDGNVLSLAEAVERDRKRVAEGETEAARDSLYELAAITAQEQHHAVARVLLRELEEIVPPAALDQRWQGWIQNVHGLIHSGSDRPLSRSHFERMRQIGIGIGDRNLEATAHQNLGILAIHDEEEEEAAEHFLAGFRIKSEIGDEYGGMQIVLNMADLMITRESLDGADRLLEQAGGVLAAPGFSDLRASLFAARGQVLAKREKHDEAKEMFSESLRQARQAQSSVREAAAAQNLGANARQRGDNRGAIRWYRKSLDLIRGLRDRHKERALHVAIGGALADLGEWDAAAKQFSAAAQIAEGLEDAEAEADAWASVGACWSKVGKLDDALKLIEGAMSNPRSSTDSQWRIHQLRNLAEVLNDLGRPEQALNRLREAANLASGVEEKDSALSRAAQIALINPGLAGEAPELLRKALVLHEVGAKSDWAWRAATFGSMLNTTSQAARADEFFTLALRVFARNGDRRRAFFIRNDRAIGRSNGGDLAGAAADLRAALLIAEEQSDKRLEFQAKLNFGEIERRREHRDKSEKHLLEALENARRRNDRSDEADAQNLLGLLRADAGDLADAEAAYLAALEIGRQLKDPEIQCGSLGGLGGVAYRRKQFSKAANRYRQAIRQHPEDVLSFALAEDLGGFAMSAAGLGRLEAETVESLVDLSGQIGWDHHCAPELSTAAGMLSDAGGSLEEAIQLRAWSIMCAFRAIYVRDVDGDGAQEEPIQAMVRVMVEVILWMQSHDDYSGVRERLVGKASEALELGDDWSVVDDFLSDAEAALAGNTPSS